MNLAPAQPAITVEEARAILGTTAKGLSDDAIARLVSQVDVLTDIVVGHLNDSKVQSRLDKLKDNRDNES